MKVNPLLKILMIIMILMISSAIFAQTHDDYDIIHVPPRPGDALITFAKTFYTGFALQVVGAGCIVIAQSTLPDADDSTIKTLSYVGGTIALLGSIVELVSFAQIGKAGRQLNELQRLKNNDVSINIEPNQYGVGIVCRF
jgi:uncharacterized membrane protein YkvI